MSKVLIPSQQIEELRAEMVPLKRELRTLRDAAKEIYDIIGAGSILSESLSEKFKLRLTEYDQRITRMKKLSNSLNIPLQGNIADVEKAIQKKAVQLQVGTKQRVLEDYFRITASSQSVLDDLELSKKKLLVFCRTAQLSDLSFLKPYEMVVRLIYKNNEEELSDDDFDLIEENICRSVARALDRKALTIESDKDISNYMDGSCALLSRNLSEFSTTVEASSDSFASATSEHKTDNKQTIAGKEIPVSNSQNSSFVELRSPAGMSRQWARFAGYADNVIISYTDTQFQSGDDEKFIELARQKAFIPFALYLIAHQKFVQMQDIDRIAQQCDISASELYRSLIDERMITRITVKCNSTARMYFMLTSKAWEYYAQNKVVRYLNSKRPPTLSVPKQVWLSPAMMKPADALRVAVLHDYFSAAEHLEKIVIFLESDRRPLFATGLTADKNTFSIYPAILDAGFEKDNFTKLCNLVSQLGNRTQVIIQEKTDLDILSAQMQLRSIQVDNIKFCIAGQSNAFYNWKGELQNHGDTTVSD